MKNVWLDVHKANEIYKDANEGDNRIITKNLQISLNNSLSNNMAIITPGWSLRANTIIYQNLLQMGSSYVVVDPQGELHSMCSKRLIDNGYTVKVLDLINIDKSVRFDPFAVVECECDVSRLADYFIEYIGSNYQVKEETDPFRMHGLQLYSYILFFTAWYQAKEKGTKATMMDVAKLVEMSMDVIGNNENGVQVTKLSQYMQELEEKELYSACVQTYHQLMKGSQETVDEIFSIYGQLFEICDVKKDNSIFSGNDINLRELGMGMSNDTKNKMAVFIKVSIYNNKYNWIGSLFLTQCAKTLSLLCEEICGPLPVRVEFFLNDMALGCVPVRLEKTLSLSSGRNIFFVLNFHTLEQLQVMYPENAWQCILDNIGVIVYTGNNNSKETIEYVSELLGSTIHKGLFRRSKWKKRSIMSLAELRNIPNRAAIVLISGSKPIYDKKAYDLQMMYSGVVRYR